jgi:CrcB protein
VREPQRADHAWPGSATAPIDPELDDGQEAVRHRRGHRVLTLAVVAAGGAAGALARYGLSAAFPATGHADWATLGINTAGGLAIGLVMAVLTASRSGHPLVRAFAVTGVLGGFTTFSTAIVDVQRSLDAGAPGTAFAYLAGTAALSVFATVAGLAAGGWLMRQERWFLAADPAGRDDGRRHDQAAAGPGPVQR